MAKSAARTASKTNAAAAAPAPAASGFKTLEVFHTFAKSKGTPVSLWTREQAKAGTPNVDGKIGDLRVAGYVHGSAKGLFLSFIDSKAGKGADGNYTQVATGNVVVAEGRAKLVITMADGKTKVWAEASKRAPIELLESFGLNVDTLAFKRAERAAAKEGATA